MAAVYDAGVQDLSSTMTARTTEQEPPAETAERQASDADRLALEVSLLRDQLRSVLELMSSVPAQAPVIDPARHDGRTPEVTLLQELLHSLAPQIGRDAPTALPADIASPAGSDVIETAIARLLAELVEETDRRIRAETEASRARAHLRALGQEDRPNPMRPPVPPRRA